MLANGKQMGDLKREIYEKNQMKIGEFKNTTKINKIHEGA